MDSAFQGNDVAQASPTAERGFPKDLWTIGEMSRHFDVSLRTLRFYEDRGLITPLRHGANRFYDSHCRQQLERILGAKKLGFTLSRIQMLLETGGAGGIAEALSPNEILARIDALERRKADIDQAISDLRAAHARYAPAAQPLARAG